MKPLFHYGYKHVNGHGDPYLGFYGVFRGTKEGLDSQVLFDPFEKQLNLPSASIQ
jgi:hypothetical protein